MACGAFQYLAFFIWSLFLSSVALGSSVAETTPPLEAIQKTKAATDQGDRILFSTPLPTTTQLDTNAVPIVNPTTPGMPSPIVEFPPPPTAITTPINPPAGTTAPGNPPAGTTAPGSPPAGTTAPGTPTPTSTGRKWCVASPTASPTALQVALDYACGYGGADCSAIQSGASCFNPNTVRDHASYAFNDYYQKNPVPTSCVFGGAAQLTDIDPSNGNCHYASSRTTSSQSPPATPTPINATPSTMTPPTIGTPYGPTVFGEAEPTGQPNSATSTSCSLLLLFSATGVLGMLLAANHI